MTVEFFQAVKAQGRTGLVASTIEPTDPAAPSLASDINATTALNVSLAVFGEIAFTTNVSKGEAPARMGTIDTLQEFGRKSYEIGQIMLVWDPQEADEEDVNAAKAMFADGAELWFYIRRGPVASTPYVLADRVETRHVTVDGGRPGKTGDGEFDQFTWIVDAIDLEPPVYDAVIAA